MATNRTYMTWYAMVARCTNPKDKRWEGYGSRGITVCERWMKYENFLADMGRKPAGLTLERIDVNGDYSPENCKWASWAEQARNRTNNRWVEHNGDRITHSELARRLGVSPAAIHYRARAGKPLDTPKSKGLPKDGHGATYITIATPTGAETLRVPNADWAERIRAIASGL